MKKSIILLAVLTIIGCQTKPRTISRQSMQYLTVSEVTKDSRLERIQVSGLIGNSALCIKEIKVIEGANEINITLHLGYCVKGRSPDFQKIIEVPPHIQSVTFGQERAKIWEKAR